MSTGPNILLADDEERFRQNLQKMLRAHGLAVTAVGSGEEALAALAAQPYDVILLDVRMPGLSGLETLAALKANYPQTEVIVLTGHASVDTAAEIIRLGAFELLLKPCPVEEILAKIESAYERLLARRG